MGFRFLAGCGCNIQRELRSGAANMTTRPRLVKRCTSTTRQPQSVVTFRAPGTTRDTTAGSTVGAADHALMSIPRSDDRHNSEMDDRLVRLGDDMKTAPPMGQIFDTTMLHQHASVTMEVDLPDSTFFATLHLELEVNVVVGTRWRLHLEIPVIPLAHKPTSDVQLK